MVVGASAAHPVAGESCSVCCLAGGRANSFQVRSNMLGLRVAWAVGKLRIDPAGSGVTMFVTAEE